LLAKYYGKDKPNHCSAFECKIEAAMEKRLFQDNLAKQTI